MPYDTNADLPQNVRNVLPEHAQDIYREAFNSAWEQYDEPGERQGGRTQEQTAHSVAWTAVKHEYEKDAPSGKWVRKDGQKEDGDHAGKREKEGARAAKSSAR